MTDETDKDAEAERPAGAAAAEPVDPLTELRDENARLKDQLLRTLADMENLRKRTSKELREARDYAVSGFARDMLGVGDNLRRALEAVGEEARAAADASLTGLLDGVEMTEREMLKLMEKHGVRKVDPKGERFDPNLHQAMFEVPKPEVASGTVVEVVQVGYVIGERMLRPAMVGVAKGGPKMPKPAAEAETPADDPAPPADDPAPPGSTVDKTA